MFGTGAINFERCKWRSLYYKVGRISVLTAGCCMNGKAYSINTTNCVGMCNIRIGRIIYGNLDTIAEILVP
ncbi:MAG: hypothetical protein IPH45_16380 [Bacteroidales bacterium]|nr:hypothetical protein [Bacteroidales bacterium]